METGSNKSLFTLIAVVIFGIFLSLSYWLFQDEMKNVLASVMDSTSQKVAYITTKELKSDNEYVPSLAEDFNSESMKINAFGNIELKSSTGNKNSGFRINSDYFKDSTNYMMSFKLKKTSGSIPHIGGHLTVSEHTTIYIDGVLVSEKTITPALYRYNGWYYGFPYINDNKEHEIIIYFDTNFLNRPEDNFEFTNKIYTTIYLQPNRTLTTLNPYTLDIFDIYLKEL